MNPASDPTRLESSNQVADNANVNALMTKVATGLRSAQERWARVPLRKRLACVRRLRHLIADQSGALARLTAFARRRPVAETIASEIIPLAEACHFLERNAGRLLQTQRIGRVGRPLWLTGVNTQICREPYGIILIIAPGNFPLLLPGVQVIQALVAGNAVLWKPGPGGSDVAAELARLLERAGFDRNLVVRLPETTAAARAAILSRPNKVIFTGSAETGEKILAQLAPLVIPATMELSGCDAVIIRADADLDLAVKALIFGLKLNGGATCMAPKRVFVAAACATELEGRLAEALRADEFQLSIDPRLTRLLEEALGCGGHLIAGEVSDSCEIRGPVVIGGVSPTAALLRADVFAPVLTIVTVANDDEAVTHTNNCPYGLAVSIFSRDEKAARALAGSVRAGVVTINDLILPAADARTPFGGRGRSGFGVTQGAEGLLEMTVPKVITATRNQLRPAFGEPRLDDEHLFTAYLALTHGRDLGQRVLAFASLVRSLFERTRTARHSNSTSRVAGLIWVLALFASAGASMGADWPQRRGPANDGTSTESSWVHDWPAKNSAALWKTRVGTVVALEAASSQIQWTSAKEAKGEYRSTPKFGETLPRPSTESSRSPATLNRSRKADICA